MSPTWWTASMRSACADNEEDLVVTDHSHALVFGSRVWLVGDRF